MIRKILLSLLILFAATSAVHAEESTSTFSERKANLTEVGAIRVGYGSGTVRIVVDVTRKVEFTESYAENPSRVIIDLKNTWLSPTVKREIELNSLAAKKIRVAQFNPTTVRIVIESMANIKPFHMSGGPKGYRFVIDVGNTAFKDNSELNKPTPAKPKSETPASDDKERQEREIKERELKEQQEREIKERELKEQQERELKERQEREIKERELKEQQERELKERQEREIKERELKERQEREIKERELKEQQEREIKERQEREIKERELKERQEREIKERELKEQQERELKERQEREIKERELKEQQERELKEQRERELKEQREREKALEKERKKKLEREIKEQREREKQLEKERKEREKKERKEREKKNKDKKSKDDEAKEVDRPFSELDNDLTKITALSGKKIVIDPGHGGNDAGAIGPTGVMEKNVTLKVSLELRRLLEAEGATVIMTRDTDRTVSAKGAAASDIEELGARCEVANFVKADIFISIHADSFTRPEARGTTGYYYSKSTTGRGQKLADAIRRNLVEQLGTPSRGTQPCNFYVVKNTDMPATLIELGFISNKDEEKLLNSDEGVKKAAQAILDGIEDYFG